MNAPYWNLKDWLVVLALVVIAVALPLDIRQHERSARDRAELRQEQETDRRTTVAALNARGNLYRWTLNYQMDAMHLTAAERAQVNAQADAAGLPETTTILK